MAEAEAELLSSGVIARSVATWQSIEIASLSARNDRDWGKCTI